MISASKALEVCQISQESDAQEEATKEAAEMERRKDDEADERDGSEWDEILI